MREKSDKGGLPDDTFLLISSEAVVFVEAKSKVILIVLSNRFVKLRMN
jgi:hypothetical protein